METPRDRDDQLAADLRALRPKPRPRFSAELDERAAAGFPRRSWLPWLSLEGFGALKPRRLLVAAGSLAILAIAVATAVVTLEQGEEAPGGGASLSLTDQAGRPAQRPRHSS